MIQPKFTESELIEIRCLLRGYGAEIIRNGMSEDYKDLLKTYTKIEEKINNAIGED